MASSEDHVLLKLGRSRGVSFNEQVETVEITPSNSRRGMRPVCPQSRVRITSHAPPRIGDGVGFLQLCVQFKDEVAASLAEALLLLLGSLRASFAAKTVRGSPPVRLDSLVLVLVAIVSRWRSAKKSRENR